MGEAIINARWPGNWLMKLGVVVGLAMLGAFVVIGLAAASPPPHSSFAYVVDTGDGTVAGYSLDGTNALLPLSPASTAAGGPSPTGIAVSPDGRSVYVTNREFNAPSAPTISQYDVDPSTGALKPKVPALVASAIQPSDIAITPDGRSVYVTHYDDSVTNGPVSEYDVDPATGVLTPKSPATVMAGFGPDAIAVSPDGRSITSATTWAARFLSTTSTRRMAR